MKKRKPAKKSCSYRCARFGILNHLGTIWTPETFATEPGAQDYLDKARSTWPDNGAGLNHHKVVPVRVTITHVARARR